MLPKLASNFYKVKLPVSKRDVKYRPWLQGEEVRLLKAKGVSAQLDEQGKKEEAEQVIAEAISEIAGIVSNGSVDGDKDSYVDVLYIFMLSRARAVGEASDITFPCDCDKKGVVRAKANVANIKVTMPDVETDFSIGADDNGNDVRVTLGSLSFMDFNDAQKSKDDMVVIRRCIKKLYTDETSYDLDSESEESWMQWYYTLPTSAYAKIEAFIANPPVATCKADGICDKCKKQVSTTLSGMGNFL